MKTQWIISALLVTLLGACGGENEVWYLQVREATFVEDDEQPNVCLVVTESTNRAETTSSDCTEYVAGEPTLRGTFEPATMQPSVQLRTQSGAVLVLPVGADPVEGILEASEGGRTLIVELALDELSNDYVY